MTKNDEKIDKIGTDIHGYMMFIENEIAQTRQHDEKAVKTYMLPDIH